MKDFKKEALTLDDLWKSFLNDSLPDDLDEEDTFMFQIVFFTGARALDLIHRQLPKLIHGDEQRAIREIDTLREELENFRLRMLEMASKKAHIKQCMEELKQATPTEIN